MSAKYNFGNNMRMAVGYFLIFCAIVVFVCKIPLLARALGIKAKQARARDDRLYARYLCSRDALGLKAEQPVGQARRATIGYRVYKTIC